MGLRAVPKTTVSVATSCGNLLGNQMRFTMEVCVEMLQRKQNLDSLLSKK